MITDERLKELWRLLVKHHNAIETGTWTLLTDRELLNAIPTLLDALEDEQAVARVLATELVMQHMWCCGWIPHGFFTDVNLLEDRIRVTLDWARERAQQRKAAADVKENNKRFDAMGKPLTVDQQHRIIGTGDAE